MILRIACTSLIMLGVTVGLTVILSMSSEEFITIWLATSAASALADWLISTPNTAPSVLDLFERIEQ